MLLMGFKCINKEEKMSEQQSFWTKTKSATSHMWKNTKRATGEVWNETKSAAENVKNKFKKEEKPRDKQEMLYQDYDFYETVYEDDDIHALREYRERQKRH